MRFGFLRRVLPVLGVHVLRLCPFVPFKSKQAAVPPPSQIVEEPSFSELSSIQGWWVACCAISVTRESLSEGYYGVLYIISSSIPQSQSILMQETELTDVAQVPVVGVPSF